MQETINSEYDDELTISSTESELINCADQPIDGNDIQFILTNAR